jgi:hypothetical protein
MPLSPTPLNTAAMTIKAALSFELHLCLPVYFPSCPTALRCHSRPPAFPPFLHPLQPICSSSSPCSPFPQQNQSACCLLCHSTPFATGAHTPTTHTPNSTCYSPVFICWFERRCCGASNQSNGFIVTIANVFHVCACYFLNDTLGASLQ